MRNVFDYDDYRPFINDTLNEKNITASAVATKLQLKSKSYLGLILRGQKRLQAEQVHALKDILELTAVEFDYFFHLVFFCDSSTKAAKAYHKDKITNLRHKFGSAAKSKEANESILSKWYYPVLILNSTLESKVPDAVMRRKLGIEQTEFNQAIEELTLLGYIKSPEFESEPLRLKVAKRTWSQIQKNFLKSHIENSLTTFDEKYESKGKYYSQTICCSKTSFEETWQLIKDSLDRLADRVDSEPSEDIIQLNLQFFRVL